MQKEEKYRPSHLSIVRQSLVSTESEDLDWLVQVCLIRVGAKFSQTVALQEQVWTSLVYEFVSCQFSHLPQEGSISHCNQIRLPSRQLVRAHYCHCFKLGLTEAHSSQEVRD